ncbi:hypothetical protein IWW57_004384, partial [Coemansia sp. S610]
ENDYMHKGLIAAVLELSITIISSGANNVEDIDLVPSSAAEIRYLLSKSQVKHSRGGLDALKYAFWFNAEEVRMMLINCAARFDRFDAYHDDAMDKFRKSYNWYYIGCFSGKYGPLS